MADRKAVTHFRFAMTVYYVTDNGKGNSGLAGGILALKPSFSPNLCKDWLTITKQKISLTRQPDAEFY